MPGRKIIDMAQVIHKCGSCENGFVQSQDPNSSGTTGGIYHMITVQCAVCHGSGQAPMELFVEDRMLPIEPGVLH